MKYLIQTWLLLLLSLPGLSIEAANLDSLLSVVESEPDTQQVKTYGLLAFGYLRLDADSSRLFAEQQLALAEKLEDRWFMLVGHSHLSLAYKYLGDYQEALEHEFASLEIGRTDGFDRSIPISLATIGLLYKRLGDYERAEPFFLEAIELNQRWDNQGSLTANYLNYGTLLDDMNRFGEAVIAYEKAAEISKAIGREDRYQLAQDNLGSLYLDQGELDKARPYVAAGLAYAEKEGDMVSLDINQTNLGLIEEESGNLEDALTYYEQATQTAVEAGFRERHQQLLHDQARVLGLLGRYERGFQLEQLAYRMQDTLFEENKVEALAEIQEKIEVAERDLKIARLEEDKAQQDLENTRLWAGMGAVALLMLAGLMSGLWFRQRQLARFEAEKVAARQAQLKATLEAEENERERIATELHDSLGQLLSTTKLQLTSLPQPAESKDQQVLSGALHLLDESVGEVRQISHNLAPPALMRGDLISALRDLVRLIRKTGGVKVSLENEVQQTQLSKKSEIHLYRIIQELINNSLKHSGCSEIALRLWQHKGSLWVEIQDNGQGLASQTVPQHGLGWQSILGRLQLLNGKHELIQEPEQGLKVRLKIPFS
ncbi:MAG: sensor histidine kinase [Bacteroidota bacterium]